MADFAERSLGIGDPGASLLLLACVLVTLFAWWCTLGTLDLISVSGRREEGFCWLTITSSQMRRTAIGDGCAGR
ncbi:MAG: hypothetical protein JWO25_2711 [Alphaproteobacteria bacterium]|nr:hypothetical protein [Alphaproteobacteria bacterium]